MIVIHSTSVVMDGNDVFVLGNTYGKGRPPPSAWFPTSNISNTVISMHAPISVQYCCPPSGDAAGEKSGSHSSKPMLRLSAVS